MTELVAACANLRILINRIEEAIAFNLPLNEIENIASASQFAEAFLNTLNQQMDLQ